MKLGADAGAGAGAKSGEGAGAGAGAKSPEGAGDCERYGSDTGDIYREGAVEGSGTGERYGEGAVDGSGTGTGSKLVIDKP